MSAPINFIAPAANKLRLSKTVTTEGTEPYPQVKTVSSLSYNVGSNLEGLQELKDLLVDNAKAGNALIKGPLKEPINRQSRAGKCDTRAATSLMVLDIDGWMPDTPLQDNITQADLVRAAENVVNLLPEPLSATSYIVNASSSTGINASGEIGLHFFFLLDSAVHPSHMEGYLKHLNFACEDITDRIKLQDSKMNVKWIVDPVVARNAQLIYIAPPTFGEGTQDPFESHEDRWALVKKSQHTCNLATPAMAVDRPALEGRVNRLLNQLRRKEGLSKFKPRSRTMTVGGERQRVLTNPTTMTVKLEHVTDEFAYWNVNGGDSRAYWCPAGNPEIIYNFKGEQPFLLKAADQDAYNEYVEAHGDKIRQVNEVKPLLIRDPERDALFAVEYIPAHNTVHDINEISRQSIEDWMADFGTTPPDAIPSWRIRFDPHSTVEVDFDNRVINTFTPTEIIRNPPMVMPHHQALTLGQAAENMQQLCPTIYKVLFHICGSSHDDFEAFINWLAFAMQERRKAHTAWVFSGVPGTGKGIFYERILRPIMGKPYTIRKRLDHLEEQFNAYQEEALFLIWEEFRLKDSKQSGKLLNKMKDDITADEVNIRAMRSNVRSVDSYTNYIFFSNHTDVIPVEKGDRRFNIAPPQMERLEVTYPEIRTAIQNDRIEDELGSFAGLMLTYDFDEQVARTERNNDAKESMRIAAMSSMDQFAHAINTGDLTFFYRIEDCESATTPDKAMRQKIATTCLNAWKDAALGEEPAMVTLEALHVCFEVIFEDTIAAIKLQNALVRRDVIFKRRRTKSGKRKATTLVHWQLNAEEHQELESDAIAYEVQQDSHNDPHPLMH
ncbi:primase-helicase family protein [Vreelandella jeotgali]|uniref:primase-helicase family protein n=1 Tax=Vreelandella jeotgali TaxID=553386 RepID=UPI000348FABF|nr:primase-helicase family protein [Halomonas jeotgali]